MPAPLYDRDQFEYMDDFQWYIVTHMWASLIADSGSSCAITAAGVGGIVNLGTGTTDNNEAAIKTANETFLIAANKPIMGECALQFTEGATNVANVAFGFADSFGANLLVDDGAGPKTSFSGALIYKVDGGTVWKCVSSKSTTQTISTSTLTAGTTAYQKLRIEIRPVSSTVAEVTFFSDGVPLLDSTTLKPIKHNMTYTSAVAMAIGAYVKEGSATAESLNVDYIAWAAKR